MNNKFSSSARNQLPGLFGFILLLGCHAVAGALPEYTVAEAAKHIGENATVIGKVACVECVTGCYISFGDCGGDATFFVHLPENPPGPKLDVDKLKGTTIAVSGNIGGTPKQPHIVAESTSQIALPKEPTSNGLETTIAREEKLLEVNPKDAKAYFRRGLAREKKADLDHSSADYRAAINDYEQSLRLDPSDSDAFVHVGDCYAAINDYNAAKRSWDNAIDVSPQAKELLQDSLAKERTRYFYAAIHDLDKLTEMEPKNAAFYFRKANLYAMAQEAEHANQNFKLAAQLEPTNVSYDLQAAHPVSFKRQLTLDEIEDKVINAGAALGGAAGAAAILGSNHSDPGADASGGSQDDRRICPTCGGRGSVDSYEWDMSGRTKVLSFRICPTCLGSGYVR